MTRVYFVRHALPNYQNHNDLTRELTSQGLEDRKRVTEFLGNKEIVAVLSSPYKRAYDTVMDFADKKQLGIKVIDDFRERKIEDGWIEDFNSFCKKQWEDFDFKLSGGESLREVQRRNICALKQVLKEYEGKNVAIGSHGTALGTIIHFYDPSFGYDGFQEIRDRMPWVAGLFFEGGRCVGIRKYDLFEGPGDREK